MSLSVRCLAFAGAMGLALPGTALADPPEAYVFAGIPSQYTSNAFLTENDAKQDFFANPRYGLGVRASQIPLGAGMLAYNLNAFLDNAWFNDFGTLDGDATGGAAELAYTKGNWTFGAGYEPSWSYTSNFDEFIVGLHDLSLSAAYKRTFGKTTIVPAAFVARRLSADEGAERVGLGGRLAFVYQLATGLTINVSPTVTQLWYDTFPGEDRIDTIYGISAGLGIALAKGTTLNIGVARLIRDSTVTGLDFDRTTAGPTLGLEFAF